jgi:hypothetical protein
VKSSRLVAAEQSKKSETAFFAFFAKHFAGFVLKNHFTAKSAKKNLAKVAKG